MLLSPPHPTASLRSPRVLLPILSHVQLLRTHSTEGKPSEPPNSSAQRRVRGPLAGKDSLLLFPSMDFHRSGRYFSSLRCRETKSRIPRRGVCQSHLSNTDGRFFFFPGPYGRLYQPSSPALDMTAGAGCAEGPKPLPISILHHAQILSF